MRVLLDLSDAKQASVVRCVLGALNERDDELLVAVAESDQALALALGRHPSCQLHLWTASGLGQDIDASLWLAFVAQFSPELVVLADSAKWPWATRLVAPVVKLEENLAGLASDELRQAIRLAAGHAGIVHAVNPSNRRQLKRQRLKLALVSPILPARSGIADYTADMITALSEHYEITLIDTTPQRLRDWDEHEPDTAALRAGVHDPAWLLQHRDEFDRVVYQVGNSGFHDGMRKLMRQIPGVAELHDFFLGDGLNWEQLEHDSTVWHQTLTYEHGFKALGTALTSPAQAVLRYPVNHWVFRDSIGVIVHSEYARQLAARYVGAASLRHMTAIGLFRNPVTPVSQADARRALDLGVEDFVVCSFGFIGPLKLHDRLVAAWAASDLARDPRAKLVLVGQHHSGEFGEQLDAAIKRLANPEQVRITGFASQKDFKLYLDAADYAVQLRTNSRGETSGVVSHALNHGLPLIVNANGSFAEIDPKAAMVLPDAFDDADLVAAMNELYRNAEKRLSMAKRGPVVMQQEHSPAKCAKQFHEFVESVYRQRLASHPQQVLTALQRDARLGKLNPMARAKLAGAIARNHAVEIHRPRLLLDITATHRTPLKSGIERVALALCEALIALEPELGVVTPVYLTEVDGQWRHYKANAFMRERLDTGLWLDDHVVHVARGDTLLTLDLAPEPLSRACEQGLLRDYRARGVRCYSIVYDLLPISMPKVFPVGTDERHVRWTRAVSSLDGALCISEHVSHEVRQWQLDHHMHHPKFRIGSFLLGADTETFVSTSASLKESLDPHEVTGSGDSVSTTFLMVGTIEPRKGYLETIRVFSELWQSGFDARLVIVGREGWIGLADEHRREIPATLDLLRNHPERGNRLIWLDGADDNRLKAAYAQADCLIAASYDEGFGLPIVEATRHRVPVLARDIPVFHEVAPAGTQFFKTGELAHAIRNWKKPEHPPEDRHTITWRQSAEQVLAWLQEATSDNGENFDVNIDVNDHMNLAATKGGLQSSNR